jgi:FkbM family methyltransferase
MRERVVQPAPGRPGWVRIAVDRRVFVMPEHRWWGTFASGWEADTLQAYRTFVRPGDTVVDVGGWIGATVMFATACGAGRVLVVEPNPLCREYLEAARDSAQRNGTAVALCWDGVGPRSGEAAFGNMDDGRISTRSGASLFGRGTRIHVEPLPVLLGRHGFEQATFLKMDIEGGEFLIAGQIAALAAQPGLRVFLSFHPPLLPQGVDRGELLKALDGFDLYDAALQPIRHEAVAQRIHSTEKRPAWGTVFGNYFELMLAPRGETLLRA